MARPRALKRSREIEPFVLDPRVGAADRLAQALGMVKRRPALAELDHRPSLHGQHLLVAPQVWLAALQASLVSVCAARARS